MYSHDHLSTANNAGYILVQSFRKVICVTADLASKNVFKIKHVHSVQPSRTTLFSPKVWSVLKCGLTVKSINANS